MEIGMPEVVPRRFILLNERFGKKINEDSRSASITKPVIENEIVLARGTLLEEICPHHDHQSANQVSSLCLRSLDHTGICVMHCTELDVQELDVVEVDLLFPVTPVRDRIKVISDRGWFENALLLSEDSSVLVNLGDNSPPIKGKLRYRGPVPELGKGILFGIELLSHPEKGDCDGSIRGKHYFHCNGNSGVFVPINHLELIASSYQYRATAAPKPLSLEEVCKDGSPPPPLKLGDHIVWISDTGPEYGEVKWLGKLPDVGDDWMVGVEFDNPIGSGTGNYNDHQLFEAKLNHASLVPIIGLMKAKDFLGTPPGTPPKPRRKKKTGEVQPGTSADRVITCQSLPQTNLNAKSAPAHLQDRDPHSLNKIRLPPLSTLSPSTNNCATLSKSLENGSVSFLSTEQEKRRGLSVNCSTEKFGKANSHPLQQQPHQQLVLNNSPNSSKYCSNLPPISSADLSGKKTGSPSNLKAINNVMAAKMLNQNRIGGKYGASLSSTALETLIKPSSAFPDKLENSASSVNPLYEMLSTKEHCGTTRYERGDDTTKSLVNSKKAVKVFDDDSYLASLLNNTDLEVGSVVEVMINGVPKYGVIRWIGVITEEANNNRLIAGIEMEEESVNYTDGTFNGKRYFQCPPQKAFFVHLRQCRKDSRFLEPERRRSAVFGSIDCPSVYGDVPPLSTPDDLRLLCGKNRGIQGHHNSCYLDATLFAMFSCTNVFDSLLHRPPGPDDIPEYTEVQRVLREEIVNPLRANLYVRADRVMQLRTLLERLSSVRGLTCEEKDPEEFLNSLLNQILKAEPFLKLSSNQESYFYQLFVEKDEKLSLPTVQQLFDQSFLTSDIKLREVPSCLLIQMPRFGKQFKMYPRIIPSQYLDITDVLEDSPRQCSVCGQVAEYECKECFGQFGEGLDSTAFCQKCIEKSHSHKKRLRHKSTKLSVPSEFRMLKDHTHVPRIYVELFAVVCIETSHYVCFVKCGSGPDAPWCFFDSMADRKGEQNGYNIPEVASFPDLRWWLSEEGASFLSSAKDDKVLPEIARRLLCDAYMCMYQSPDIMMYR